VLVLGMSRLSRSESDRYPRVLENGPLHMTGRPQRVSTAAAECVEAWVYAWLGFLSEAHSAFVST
jgi:hypothetical protein